MIAYGGDGSNMVKFVNPLDIFVGFPHPQSLKKESKGDRARPNPYRASDLRLDFPSAFIEFSGVKAHSPIARNLL